MEREPLIGLEDIRNNDDVWEEDDVVDLTDLGINVAGDMEKNKAMTID